MYGKYPKPGMSPDYFTEEVFDFIFLGEKNFTTDPKISMDVLQEMQDSFTYWYPMDLRCSGKDLITNHLIMCLYNHAAIWKNENMMPQGFFANGHVLVDGKKMSKSEGNFFTIKQIVDEFGSDSVRIALADAGDSLDDVKFICFNIIG